MIDAAYTVDGQRIGTALSAQLLLNIVVLIVVGVLTLRFVRLLWRRISCRNRDA